VQEDAVPEYIEQMIKMMSDDERPLRQSLEDEELRILARVRTLTVLAGLDGHRKAPIVQFLYEAGLITKDHNPINLRGADLTRVDLSKANLRKADLRFVNLAEANLEGAHLDEADLEQAMLPLANLRGASLDSAKLAWADLSKADLSRQRRISSPADPEKVILYPTTLFNANLSQATLRGADLRDVGGVTNEELEQLLRSDLTGDAAWTLSGATMPNGQKYEDWLNDRKDRKEGEEHA
jgi:uncharacterized protein YjbI with pentapeptide repeats